MDVVDAMISKQVFGPFFGDLETWKPAMVLLKVLSGRRDIDKPGMELFRRCTGLSELPRDRIRECYVVAGRRSGKTTISALLAAYSGLWGGWSKHVKPGEQPRAFCVATNKKQAQVAMNRIKALLRLNPTLRREVSKELSESVELKTGVVVETKPQSFRTVRGFTVGLLILEELAFWRTESESPLRDIEIYNAVTPGMLNIPNSLVVGITTPFARGQGLLWRKFQEHFGKPGPVLIWKAPTWVMNLSVTEQQIRDMYFEGLGPAAFAAEYAAEFREDIEGWLPFEIIDRAIAKGRPMLEPVEGAAYHAFADPSEGLRAGADSFTLGIAHSEQRDGERFFICDYVKEHKPPFSPAVVIQDVAATLERYNVKKVTQDRHAVAWISKDLEQLGIEVSVSEKTKSHLYEDFAILANKGVVELPDSERLRLQLLGLQRYLKSGGTVKVDHPGRTHDDYANSVAGAICLCEATRPKRKGRVFHAGHRPQPREDSAPWKRKGRVTTRKSPPGPSDRFSETIRRWRER